jgi:hypothetical protein
MKKMICTACLVFFIILSNKSFAQFSQCDIALIDNTRDEFNATHSQNYSEALQVLFNQEYNYWYNFDKQNSTGIEAGVLDIFSSSFNKTDKESEKKFISMKTNYAKNHMLSKSELLTISSKVASPTRYNAWIECIKATSKITGIELKHEGNNDDEFIVSLIWLIEANPKTVNNQVVSDIQLSNCKFISGTLIKRSVVEPWNTLLGTFKRIEDSKDATVAVSVTGLGKAKTITISKSDPLVIKKRKVFLLMRIKQSDGELEIFPTVNGIKQGSKSFYHIPYDKTNDGLPHGELNMEIPLNTSYVSSKGFGIEVIGSNPIIRNGGYCRFRYEIIVQEKINNAIKETIFPNGSIDHHGSINGVIFDENIYLSLADAIIVKSAGDL